MENFGYLLGFFTQKMFPRRYPRHVLIVPHPGILECASRALSPSLSWLASRIGWNNKIARMLFHAFTEIGCFTKTTCYLVLVVVVSLLFHCCFIVVSLLFHCCFIVVLLLFYCCWCLLLLMFIVVDVCLLLFRAVVVMIVLVLAVIIVVSPYRKVWRLLARRRLHLSLESSMIRWGQWMWHETGTPRFVETDSKDVCVLFCCYIEECFGTSFMYHGI